MANPTCREIITEALEEIRARGMGDTPDATELARGLTRLQAMFDAGVEHGTFGRVEEYYATGDYTAEEGQRVYSGGYTITLPTAIDDEENGGSRRPRDFALIQVVNAATDPEVSAYDALEAEWVRLDNLTADGECPFGRRFRHGFVAALAQAMGPLFLKDASSVTQAYAGMLRSALGLRQSTPRRNADVSYF